MENKEGIELLTRDWIDNKLIPYKENQYILKTQYDYIRCGYKDEERKEIEFVDPSGGPLIRVGKKLLEVNKVVKSIRFVKDVGCVITFE